MSGDAAEPVKTICPYCGVGCGIRVLEGEERGEMSFMPWGDAPVNEGSVCIKGGAATQVVDHEDRLTDTLIKEDGDDVVLRSRRGEITVRADVTEAIKEGVVWTTPHFAAASANRLTNDVLDERANIPEYKAAAAEIEVGIEPADETVADD